MDTKQGLSAVTESVREVIDETQMREVIARGTEPAVLRQAVGHWALVTQSRNSDASVVDYLLERDSGQPVYTIVGQPEIGGQFGFRGDFSGLNFDARQTPISKVLPHFATARARGMAIAVQAAPAAEILRGWPQENPCALIPGDVPPRMWLSTAGRVAPHSDADDNLACVAAGRRRFTLFPPEQLENLYLGPLLDSPGGVPVSSVNAWEPDLNKHPRFEAALASARAVTLEPGDALYIPALWWHAVEALEQLNLLINYWWGGNDKHGLSAYIALTHAALAISQLPAAKRARWQHYFNALVFRLDSDPAAHLPDDLADLISTPSEAQVQTLMQRIALSLRGND